MFIQKIEISTDLTWYAKKSKAGENFNKVTLTLIRFIKKLITFWLGLITTVTRHSHMLYII